MDKTKNSEKYITNLYDYFQVQGAGTGVAFSGGGSRAMAAAQGQMRGLKYLGLMDKAICLSSVSGGTWAAAAYTYLPEEIEDDDFLGGVVMDPSRLRLGKKKEIKISLFKNFR